MIKSINVYCSSSNNIDPIFIEPVEQFGRILVEQNIQLVFGGGSLGLMGVLATACMKAGGQVLGITTKYLDQYEVGNRNITNLIVVDSMEERLNQMFEASDALVVLPGGFGTLEEFFTILTRKQIGLHKKPMVLANLFGFWDHLENLMNHLISERFATKTDSDLYQFVKKVDDIVPTLEKMPSIQVDPRKKWGNSL